MAYLVIVLVVSYVIVSAYSRGRILDDIVKQAKQKAREGSLVSKKEAWDEWRIGISMVFFAGLGLLLFYLLVPEHKPGRLHLGFTVGAFLGLLIGVIWQVKAVKAGKGIRNPSIATYLIGVMILIGIAIILIGWVMS